MAQSSHVSGRTRVKLRQPYHRFGKRGAVPDQSLCPLAADAASARRLKPFLGRIARDVDRKIAEDPIVAPNFVQPLGRVARLLALQESDHCKLNALHAPEVECPAKGGVQQRL